MKVRVIADTADGRGVVTITVSDNCAICGKPRGQPYALTVEEGGRWHTVDRWENPCGHTESDTALLREAWTLG